MDRDGKGSAMDEYTMRDGSVLSVAGDRAVVRVEREEDCSGCGTCPVKALCHGRDTGHLDVAVPLGPGEKVAPGEKVRIAYRAANPAIASLVMFAPPLAGLIAAGLAAHRLWNGSEARLVIGCLAGLAAGTALTFVLSRSLRALRSEARLAGGLAGGEKPFPELPHESDFA